jgi:hypothetical protein
VLWIPRSGRDKLQYLAGLGIHVVWSPFLTQIVLFYSLLHCDDFKWGKTREVVEETEEEREILRIQNEKNDEDDLEKGLKTSGSVHSVSTIPSTAPSSSSTDNLHLLDTPKKLK